MWYQPGFSQHFTVCDVGTWRSAIPHLSDLFQAICNLVYKTSLFLGRNTSYCRVHAAFERLCRSSDPLWLTRCCLFFSLVYQLRRWNSEFLEMSKTSKPLRGLGGALRHCVLLVKDGTKSFLSDGHLSFAVSLWWMLSSEARTSHTCTQRSAEDFYQIKFLVLSLYLLLL